MKLHLWGTDFRRSSSNLRAKLACGPENRAQKVADLLALGFKDLVYLSTCNRVEFYTTAEDHFVDTRILWLKLLNYFGLSPDTYYQGFHLEGKSALRHLMRVACSLESLVVGEPQILGQLKESLSWHKEQGFPVDRELERIFQTVFETAKKVRTDTAIAEKPVSVAGLGINVLCKNEVSAPVREAVVVGRSPISRIVVQWLTKNRPGAKITWVNRSLDPLRSLPESEAVSLMTLDDFLSKPPVHTHLFTATSSLEPIFGDGFFSKLPSVPNFVFDFAQPPDVRLENPDTFSGMRLISLEGLESEANENREQRMLSVVQAEGFIENAIREYCQQQKEAPLLKEFSSIESVWAEQLASALTVLQNEVKPVPEMVPRVQHWAQNLLKKQLHQSREHLRTILRRLAGEQTPVL